MDGGTVVVVTFIGGGLEAGSLADGRYTLRVDDDRVHDAYGQRLDGDNDGAQGGDFTLQFRRLFGDADGDGRVSVRDLVLFTASLGKRRGQVGYLDFFDVDGDGLIGAVDTLRFLRNLL